MKNTQNKIIALIIFGIFLSVLALRMGENSARAAGPGNRPPSAPTVTYVGKKDQPAAIPPVISNVKASNVTQTSVKITWDTKGL